jgi:transposase-like protein
VEYLVRIEQGRDRNPSVAVVNALADALRLDAAEREHLRHLTKITGGACVGARAQPGRDVRPGVRRILHGLEPGIAVISNRLGNLLAYTSGRAASRQRHAARRQLTRAGVQGKLRRQSSPEFRADAVALVRSTDRPIAAIAHELGTGEPDLICWPGKARKAGRSRIRAGSRRSPRRPGRTRYCAAGSQSWRPGART